MFPINVLTVHSLIQSPYGILPARKLLKILDLSGKVPHFWEEQVCTVLGMSI